MKTKILLILIAFMIGSCNKSPYTGLDKNDMTDILSRCNGHVIVKAKGINEGNSLQYKHYLILVDDSLNCFEYIGADWKVNVGDTIR